MPRRRLHGETQKRRQKLQTARLKRSQSAHRVAATQAPSAFERTGKLGISDQSRDFLAWFRVTLRAAGELTEKFVDGLTAPVRALLPDEAAEKAEELLHDAVPIKEFGEELSKLPTSAAQNVTNAQRRDQLDAVTADTPPGDPFDGLEDLYPRDWTKAR